MSAFGKDCVSYTHKLVQQNPGSLDNVASILDASVFCESCNIDRNKTEAMS